MAICVHEHRNWIGVNKSKHAGLLSNETGRG